MSHRFVGFPPVLGPAAAVIVVPFLVLLAGACGRSRQASLDTGAADGGASNSSDTNLKVDVDEDPDADAAIPRAIAVFTRAGIGSEGSTGWPNIGTATADVDWGAGPFSRVALVVDLESSCFPFETWAANPPPPGQNWPASCDAFDRNFNIFLDDLPQSAPAFEIVHAVTPFGGPQHLEVDVTDLANGRPGPHRLRVEIASHSDSSGVVTGSNAGWTVSARIDVTPGAALRRVLAAISLFSGRVAAGDPWPVVAFQVPAGTTGSRLEYRTSGHGQGETGPRCNGPAEEFCDRRHQVLIDGTQAGNVSAYREDCATLCTLTHYGPVDAGFDYCRENPGGLPESVRASRANWCPGSMTTPFSWSDIPALATPGPHAFSFQVSQIATGGFWFASATYYAFGS